MTALFYNLNQPCDERFTLKTDLEVHIKGSHVNEKLNIECFLCDFIANTGPKLKEHIVFNSKFCLKCKEANEFILGQSVFLENLLAKDLGITENSC